MGLCLGYQAIPEESALFRQLINGRRIGELFARLFLYGGGPLARTTLTMDDLAHVLDDLVQYSGLFESREQAEETARDLFDGIGRAITRYPGLETRRAYLEKTHDRIKERLLEKMLLRDLYDEADLNLVEHVIYGWGKGFPDPAPRFPLRILPSSVVRQGAELLREFTPEVVFESPMDYLREDYGGWRGLYLESGERGEAILIGS